MAKAELNENTTHEELMAFVDEIHAERTAYTTPPPAAKDAKSDAQIVSEHAAAAEPKTPVAPQAKVPKGDETAEAPKKGKGETTRDRSWLDDDLRKEAAGYGIDEEDLADYESRDDLHRVMRLIDKRALAAGRQDQEDSETSSEPPRDAQGRFTKSETETDDPPAPKSAPTGTERKPSFEIKLSKDVYEPELVDQLTAMRDHYESRLAALEEAEAQAENDRFDAAVDELELPQLFGNTGSESKEELQRRSDLIVECRALQDGLRRVTGKAPALESLVARMARGLYPQEFDTKTIKSRTIKIAKQSEKRQGGSVTRPGDVPESGREWAARRFRELSGA